MEQKNIDLQKQKNQKQRGIPNPFPNLKCRYHINEEAEYVIVKQYQNDENPQRLICQLCLDSDFSQYQGHVCYYKRFFSDPTTIFENTSYKNNAFQLYCDIKRSFQLEVTEQILRDTIRDIKASINQLIDDQEKLLIEKHKKFNEDQQTFVRNSFDFIKSAIDQTELKQQLIESKNHLPGFKRDPKSLEKVTKALDDYVQKLHDRSITDRNNIQKLQDIHDRQKTFLNFDLFSQIQADAFNVLGRISNIISENYFPTSNLADDYFYTELNLQMKIKKENLRQQITLIHRAQVHGFDSFSTLRNLENSINQNTKLNLLFFFKTQQDYTFGAYVTKYQFKEKTNYGQNTDEGFIFHLQKRQFYNFHKITQLKIEDKKQFFTFGVKDIVIDSEFLGESDIGTGTDTTNFKVDHPLIYLAGQTRFKLKDFEIFLVQQS